VATTDSNHDSPIFPDRARHRLIDGPNQLWVADITYIAITGAFVYLAAILDAWSRRVVGYAISRSIDARLAVAAQTGPVDPLPAGRDAEECPAIQTTRVLARSRACL
jgi:putative transposase